MPHQIVSRDEWLAARKALLAKEKAFTKERDALSQERRRLPWVKVDKTYVFEGPAGKETLADLSASPLSPSAIRAKLGDAGCW